jgi:hypothetical protein
MKTIQSMKILTLAAAVWTASFPAVSSAAESKINFTDINGHWALSSIGNAVNRGYVDGYADRTFKPDLNITRAEFIKMAVAALGYKVDATPGAAWYAQVLAAAQSNNLITVEETGDDSSLNQPIQRLEMSKIAVRSTGTTTDEANKWMYLATSNGIINGMNESGELGTDKPTTRAQAITVIERVLQIKAGQTLGADKYATSEAEILWHNTNVYSMAPEYFGDGTRSKISNKFHWERTRFESSLGYSEVEKYVVIDIDDPRDPNRKYIQDNMRWNKRVGITRTPVAEIPDNTYVMLSFNHVVRYEMPKIPYFDMVNLYVSEFKLDTDDNVDTEGRLINVTGFLPYVNEGNGYYYQGGRIGFDEGVSEARLITGQIAPKNPRIGKNMGTSIYKQAASTLGDTVNVVVFSSEFEPSLGGK